MLASSCTIQPVAVKRIDNFRTGGGIGNPSVNFDVIVSNPNAFGLRLCELESSVILGNEVVSKVTVEKNIPVKAGSDVLIPLSVTPTVNNIAAMILSGSGSKDYRVKGNITVGKFIFRKKFPFEANGKF